MSLAEVFERVATADAPVEFTAYDGSRAGVPEADVRFDIRSPYAVSYLIQSRGALGLARAYVSGHIDVFGDMYTALVRMSSVFSDMTVREKFAVLRRVADDPLLRAAVVTRLEPPPQEVRVSRLPFLAGLRHSKRRDAQAIHHHYDVSNKFYQWVLGPSMAYTCACYPTEDATLEEAQFHKFDLVARKLALKPGMRLLDVGCGWGGMVMHAAREYGVKALGVTLSKEQAEWAQKAIASAGLADLAEVRHLDYRDVQEGEFDAISSIGLTEHIGQANLPAYFSFLYGRLRPGGRLLNHTITRPDNTEESIRREGFINRYVFPDGELEGPGYIMSKMHDAGFEVRHEENLREHYAKTLAGWCRYGFERNWIQLHQMLGVKLGPSGESGFGLRPDWEPPAL
jgi:cyclopropane-fatty-acyl-phospholipid synthase